MAAADRLAEEQRRRKEEMLKYEREAQRSQEMRREFLERSGAYRPTYTHYGSMPI